MTRVVLPGSMGGPAAQAWRVPYAPIKDAFTLTIKRLV